MTTPIAEEFALRDPYAERSLIAIALQPESIGGSAAEFAALPVAAITDPKLSAVARVMWAMIAKGVPVTPEGVMRAVVAEAAGRNQAESLGRVVADCAGAFTSSAAAPYFAERLLRLHTARSVDTAVDTIRRKIRYAAYHDDEDVMAGAVDQARSVLAEAEQGFAGVGVDVPMSLAELLEGEDEFDWLVPGLLERRDRLILTGFEGHGKSYLIAQIGLCVAAGLHPFTGDPIPGLDGGTLRTLVFDCENSRGQLRRRYRRIAGQVDEFRQRHGLDPADWKSIVRIVSRPEGVDLSTPRELARIEQACSTVAPDLLVCGPLYKMSSVDIRDEQAAQTLTMTLDGLRVRHGFTLLMEGHAGHAKTGEGSRGVRPIGSSLFLRWPEFGFGIRPDADHAHEEHPTVVDMVAWRGSRDERDWPRALLHGHSLPWRPTPDYWDRRPIG